MVVEIENFFGVYLLYNINPKYKGHTYIGFTVNPNRRVNQHNRGTQAGGAKRTSGKGPWEMVLIIHGFPNQISALRFEWAWQNPKKSRRLRHLTGQSKKETRYEFKLRIVSEMLRAGPWNRLPLTIRWLKQEYRREFAASRQPPAHMPLAFGPVSIAKVTSPTKTQRDVGGGADLPSLEPSQSTRPRCGVCSQRTKPEESTLQCVVTRCRLTSHVLCLARHFLGSEQKQLIPIEGTCPRCKHMMLWGDLIRLKNGCYQNLIQSSSTLMTEQFEDEDLDL